MSLFVSIASYCDPVLPFTLAQAIEHARHPEALHLAIVDQSPNPLPVPPNAAGGPRISYLCVQPQYSRGPCWARAVAMGLYDGEDWFLQIDSHMAFEPGWDERLVREAQALQAGRVGAVVTTYPDAFVLEGSHPVPKPMAAPLLVQVVKPGSAFAPEHAVLMFEAHPMPGERPVAGFHVGGGCLFAPGRFALEFPYDPALYFHGEEQAIALRLFTHGWDIFHIPRMPIYHLYNNGASGAPLRPLHWDQAHNAQRGEDWWQMEQRARARLAALVAGRPLGVYGVGSARSVAQFAAFSGIDYAARTLAPRAFEPLLDRA